MDEQEEVRTTRFTCPLMQELSTFTVPFIAGSIIDVWNTFERCQQDIRMLQENKNQVNNLTSFKILQDYLDIFQWLSNLLTKLHYY